MSNTKTVHGLDAQGNTVSIELAADCIVFIEGSGGNVEISNIPDAEEWQFKTTNASGAVEIAYFLGERSTRKENR